MGSGRLSLVADSSRMEVTSVLAQKGIETTMVLPEDRIWKRFFSCADVPVLRGVLYGARRAVCQEHQGGGAERALAQLNRPCCKVARFCPAIWSWRALG